MVGRSVQARDISTSVVVTGDGIAVALTFGDSGASCRCGEDSFGLRIAAARLCRASGYASWISSSPKPAGSL